LSAVPSTSRSASMVLFDHVVSLQEKRFRDYNAKRFGGLEVDQQLEAGGLLHRKIGRFCPLQDLVDIAGGLTDHFADVRSVRDERARLCSRTPPPRARY